MKIFLGLAIFTVSAVVWFCVQGSPVVLLALFTLYCTWQWKANSNADQRQSAGLLAIAGYCASIVGALIAMTMEVSKHPFFAILYPNSDTFFVNFFLTLMMFIAYGVVVKILSEAYDVDMKI